MKKEKYMPPYIKIIAVENEGIMALSGDLPQIEGGGSAWGSASTRTRQSSLEEMEDAINDFFTTN